MDTVKQATPLAGRLVLAAIFVMSALGKIGNWEGTTGYMAAKGMPFMSLFLLGAIALEVLGGASIVLGFKARLGALLLIVFLIPATLIFHNFWAFGGQQMQQQMVHFLKNLSILGGLLFVATHGAGPFSLDSRLSRVRTMKIAA